MPTYRTNGAWGSGIGVNLTPAQVDENFYDHETRIVSLETTPPTANSIETITASGFTWTVTLTDGTILDPLPVPVVYTVWRGDWQPFTLYSEADLVRVSDQGIFAVMQAHTSAATFDPDAAAGSPLAPLYLLMIGLSSLPADTTLDEISDVTITGVADNDFIAWDAGSALWTNRTAVDVAALLAGLTALDDLSDVDAAAPTLGQVLTWQGSPASWQPADVAATLDELTDVSVPAPGDGDVLTYQAGSPTGWIAAPVPDIPSALDDLTDVAAPTPADGDFLQYQSGSPAGWVNAAGTGISDLASVSLPLLSTDLILVSEGVGSPPSSYQTRKATIGDLGFTLGSTAIALASTTTTVTALTLSGGTLSGTTTFTGGTSGGIPYFGSSSQILSSAALAANFMVVGGGAGAAPVTAANFSLQLSNVFMGSFNTASAPSTPVAGFHMNAADASNSGFLADTYQASALFTGRNAGGTGATPAATPTSNTLALFSGRGHDGTSYTTDRGYVRIITSEAWSATANGTRVEISTTTPTTLTTGIAARFWGSSGVSLGGGGSDPGATHVVTIGMLKVAGVTSSFPALKRSSAELQVRLADDSADAAIKALKITTSDTAFMYNTSAALANGAAAAGGTLLNAPAAGNPTKWIPINDNGTTRYIPAW